MRKFTVKDFILYNSPCFNCGKPILFKIGYLEDKSHVHQLGYGNYITPIISGSELEIPLHIRYEGSVNLKIDCKTNKFYTQSLRHLTKYLDEHILVLDSQCNQCYTHIRSSQLHFNMEYGFIYPVEIIIEFLAINDDQTIYHLNSYYESNKTLISVFNRLGPVIGTLNVPFVPLGKFKTKSNLLKKIKMYLTFS